MLPLEQDLGLTRRRMIERIRRSLLVREAAEARRAASAAVCGCADHVPGPPDGGPGTVVLPVRRADAAAAERSAA